VSTDRDRILEQALKHELGAAGTAPAGACLDAETLGAWTDGGLSPAALAAAEAHVSSCARCQALVGSLMRSEPAGTPGTLGTLATFSLWKWWLAPIAAGVTAMTLWMVVPEQQKRATAPPQREAANPVQAPAAAPSVPPATPEKDTAVEQPADRLARRDNKVARAREDRQQAKPGDERKEEVAALQERAKLADAAAPAAPAAAAAPPASPTVVLRAPAELGALQKNAPRITAPAGIEVIHQSAPSDSVCWFVGRAGLVLLTTDAGATFKRVDLAEPLDIATVSATDERRATVTTADGRRFRTEDGGSTWRPF
jgi:Photosynthesis system II assembly factor YCF48/Putative zinc-finger